MTKSMNVKMHITLPAFDTKYTLYGFRLWLRHPQTPLIMLCPGWRLRHVCLHSRMCHKRNLFCRQKDGDLSGLNQAK